VTAVGLGTYYPWIRGNYCSNKWARPATGKEEWSMYEASYTQQRSKFWIKVKNKIKKKFDLLSATLLLGIQK
jgi:hypothetical protein